MGGRRVVRVRVAKPKPRIQPPRLPKLAKPPKPTIQPIKLDTRRRVKR